MKRKYLIIHCSDTPNNVEFTGEDVKIWHTDPKPRGNGWKQVGYKLVIQRNGTKDVLVKSNNDNVVDPWEVTNGARGFNRMAEHICLIGGRDAHNQPNLEMTTAQHDALVGELKEAIMAQPDILIAGHYQFSTKTCPNFNIEAWLKEIGVAPENIYRGA